MTPASPTPDFRSPAFLRAHIADCMAFYHPRCIDPDGGFFHYFRDDGSVYDASHRHLVSSTRYVVTLAMAARRGLGGEKVRIALQQAFDFLPVHRNPDTGGFAWLLDWRDGQARVLDAETGAPVAGAKVERALEHRDPFHRRVPVRRPVLAAAARDNVPGHCC
mgnify:CR=1 FL=1